MDGIDDGDGMVNDDAVAAVDQRRGNSPTLRDSFERLAAVDGGASAALLPDAAADLRYRAHADKTKDSAAAVAVLGQQTAAFGEPAKRNYTEHGGWLDKSNASEANTIPSHQFDELNDEQSPGDDLTDESNAFAFDTSDTYEQNISFDDKSDALLPTIFRMDDIDWDDMDETSRNNRLDLMKGRDVVTKFLQIVESQHLLGVNCTAGTALNLGEGIVERYAQDRFRVEAEVAVNRANMLTR